MEGLIVHVPGHMPGALATRLAEHTRSTGHLGQSQLKGTFTASRGFGLTFVGSSRAEAEERLPLLAPFLALLPETNPFVPTRRPNAFYFNALSLDEGAAVGLHIDSTLGEPIGLPQQSPDLVSVLYLDVPQSGGLLQLFSGPTLVGTVRPAVGDLVHFRGDLGHRVTPVKAGRRLSLVLEQYCLEDELLDRLPNLSLHSKADRVFAGPPPGRPSSGGFARVMHKKRKTGARADAKAK